MDAQGDEQGQVNFEAWRKLNFSRKIPSLAITRVASRDFFIFRQKGDFLLALSLAKG